MGSELRKILLPFGALYSGVVSVRNIGYDRNLFKSKKLPVPVISVGNISVGGSGKTPFVVFLIEKILSLGRKPAVLSRGYKRITDELVISCPYRGAEADVRMLGDEPALISQNFPNVPVAVKKDRYEAGLAVLEKFGADVFILDDGFQNRELHRDFDFVLLRSSLIDLNDNYLPAGNLRDSKNRIRKADVIILTSHGEWAVTGSDVLKNYQAIPISGVSFVPCELADRAGQALPLAAIASKEITAFCGIANPEQFLSRLQDLSAKVVSRRVFRDHH